MPSARSRRSRKSRNSIAENEQTADESSQNEGAVQSDDLRTRKAHREAYVELEERLREAPMQAAVHQSQAESSPGNSHRKQGRKSLLFNRNVQACWEDKLCSVENPVCARWMRKHEESDLCMKDSMVHHVHLMCFRCGHITHSSSQSAFCAHARICTQHTA